jgi:N-acyl-D-amino-acid deacylase
MGKPTGFMEFGRDLPKKRDPKERIKDYKELYYEFGEENVKKQVSLPWVSFGSDEGSYTTEGVFLKSNAHPRAYGNFARVLGKYTRDEKLMPLQEAIRKLAKLPAGNLKLQKRGELKVGNYADIVIFDPAKVNDNANFEKP